METNYEKSSKDFAYIEGLGTKQSLNILHNDILHYLDEFERGSER